MAIGRRAWRQVRALARGSDPRDLKALNVDLVAGLTDRMAPDAAMERAVGDGFDAMGAVEAALVRHYGLPRDGYLIDVGCGSGRLAKPLAAWLQGRYLGLDLVPALLAHARKVAARPDWRFVEIDHIAIPEADGQADMVVFFSVLTHLLPEQGYWYLEEARRVLKPGGRVLVSFLEFAEPAHWAYFDAAVAAARRRSRAPLNIFLERPVLALWAERLGLRVVAFRAGGEDVGGQGVLGQSLCVLEKPN